MMDPEVTDKYADLIAARARRNEPGDDDSTEWRRALREAEADLRRHTREVLVEVEVIG